MVSDEWWIFHLTKEGWVAGSYKHDFEKEVTVAQPESVLTRKYYERLGHPHAKMEIGYDNIGGISDMAKELLRTFPHPEQFKNLS